MSYLGGHAVLHVKDSFISTWLDHRSRQHARREVVSALPTGPSEQALREIARMDQEIAAKLTQRRSEHRTWTKKSFASPQRAPRHEGGRS